MLTFEPTGHRYAWHGVPVPSVTQVLAPLVDLSRIPSDVLETARQRGIATHRMVELDAAGDLDEATLPEWMRPVLVQWRKFVADTGFEIINSEYRVYHRTFCFAGTLDLFGYVNRIAAFIDVKRSFVAGAATGIQLAAYREAYCDQERVGKGSNRYALKLNESGPYRLEPFTDPKDWGVFLSLLTISRWKEQHA